MKKIIMLFGLLLAVVTAEAQTERRISNIRIKTDKKGNTTFVMNVMGTGLSASIDIRLYNGNNRVSVTVNPNFHSNRVTLNGRLLPTEWSYIHQGRTF